MKNKTYKNFMFFSTFFPIFRFEPALCLLRTPFFWPKRPLFDRFLTRIFKILRLKNAKKRCFLPVFDVFHILKFVWNRSKTPIYGTPLFLIKIGLLGYGYGAEKGLKMGVKSSKTRFTLFFTPVFNAFFKKWFFALFS